MESSVQRVTIERVVQGGDGLARLEDGRVVMVGGVLPGETVEVRVTEQNESYARAELVDVVEGHASREEAACPFAAECGGCRFWHTDQQTQFELKVEAAIEALDRVAGVAVPEVQRFPAPSSKRYRTHATFHRRHVDREAQDDSDAPPFEIGFFERGSDELVAIDDCLVAVEAVNRARRAIEPALKAVGEADLLIETADATECVVSIRVQSADDERWTPPDSFAEWGNELDEVSSIRGVRVLTDEREWVLGDPTVDAGECLAVSPVESMRVPAGLFRQANPAINREVVGWVADQLAEYEVSSVLELFCGTGNISFGVRPEVERLVGLEVAEQAVQTANTMATFKQIEGFEFRERDLGDGTGDAVEEVDGPFDAVVLDPPRGGAKGVVGELVDQSWMGRDVMIYVSCDPPAFARDLETLTAGPWELREMAAFDMFPMTAHLEMGGVLARA